MGTTLTPLLYVVGLDGLLLGDLLDHRDRGLGELAGVLEHRGVLLARQDRLDRLDLGVLPGDDGQLLAATAVSAALEGSDDAPRQTVIRGKDALDVAARVGLGQDVLHPHLGDCGVPAQRGNGLEVRLTRGDHDLLGVDERLKDLHRALEEERGVVVVGGAGEQLDVPRGGLAAGLETVDQGLGLELADLVVVERRVVVDGRRVEQQTVVGDDRDAGVLGLLQRSGEGGAVDGGNDQDLVLLDTMSLTWVTWVGMSSLA